MKASKISGTIGQLATTANSPSTPHDSVIKHAGDLVVKSLPHLGEIAAAAAQAAAAGVIHLSPQAALVATALQLLAASHAKQQ